MRLATAALVVSAMYAGAAPGCATQKQSSIKLLEVDDVPGWEAGAGLQCRGGVWALVNESETSGLGGFSSGTTTRPFTERLFFCCPTPGEPPVCHRAVWRDGGTVTLHTPAPGPMTPAPEAKVVPTAPPQSHEDEEARPPAACAELCGHYVALVKSEGLEVGNRARTCVSECPKWSTGERRCAAGAATLGQMQECLEP